ncbi:MAG: hypothetical protein ACLSGK_14195 [Lachnospiraceae bacterium]
MLAQFQFMDEMMKDDDKSIFDDDDEIDTFRAMPDLIMMSWNLWIRMSLIFNRRVQLTKSNIEMKMELMEQKTSGTCK